MWWHIKERAHGPYGHNPISGCLLHYKPKINKQLHLQTYTFISAIFLLSLSNTYIFQQELDNGNVVFACSHMKRCPTFAVNKCYSTDRWVFTGQELYYRHRSLFTGHVECCDPVCSLLNTHSTKVYQIATKHTLQLEKWLLASNVIHPGFRFNTPGSREFLFPISQTNLTREEARMKAFLLQWKKEERKPLWLGYTYFKQETINFKLILFDSLNNF